MSSPSPPKIENLSSRSSKRGITPRLRKPAAPEMKEEDMKIELYEKTDEKYVHEFSSLVKRNLDKLDSVQIEEENLNEDQEDEEKGFDQDACMDFVRSKFDLKYIPVVHKDPRTFKQHGYFDQLRFFQEIQLATVVTMYNEPHSDLVLTVRGICQNVRYISEKTEDSTFWQKFLLVIVCDGLEKLDQETFQTLHNSSLCDKNIILSTDEEPNLELHLFQSCNRFADSVSDGSAFPPLQVLLMIKQNNCGKISSHWWFFEAICANIDPTYIVLLDVGTRPLRKAFYHIYRAFQRNKQIAAMTGELRSREIITGSILISAQYFEYKIAAILDRTMESLCGYISVLPGCFSAYRYQSLQGSPLRQYFSYLESARIMNPFEANMYLVEDRLLCMEIFARSETNQTLHAERQAISETDVCVDLIELLKQRRRWYNGTFCAMLFMLFQYHRIILHPQHSFFRKLITLIDFLFYAYLLISGWFLTGIYILFIDLNLELFLRREGEIALLWVIRGIFWALLVVNLTVGLIGNPKQWRIVYNVSALFFGALFGLITGVAIYFTIASDGSARQTFLIVCLLVNLGVYVLVGFFYGEFVTVLLSFWQWWCSLPVYVLMIPIFAFTNLHDISWGTKNLDSSAFNSDDLIQRRQFKARCSRFRNIMLLAWMLCNVLVIKFGRDAYEALGSEAYFQGFFLFLTVVTLAAVSIRLIGSIIYRLVDEFNKRKERLQNEEEIKNRNDVQQNSEINMRKCVSFLFPCLDWKAFVSLVNVTLASPCFGVLSFLWMVAGLALCTLFFITPFGPIVLSLQAISLRFLCQMEFSYNSFDGDISSVMFPERAQKHLGLGKLVIPRAVTIPESFSFPDTYKWMMELLQDPYTKKCLVYLSYIKPFSALFLSAISIGFLGFSFLLLLNFVLLPSMPIPLSVRIIAVVCGVPVLILSMHAVKRLDFIGRQVASLSLGQQCKELRVVQET